MATQVTFSFLALAVLTLGASIFSVTLRNLVHCALALAGAFAGLGALYLQLDAQFVGFAQILVYVGAVAILIVFAILLTQGRAPAGESVFTGSWVGGVLVALLVFAVLAGVILSSKALSEPLPQRAPATVQQIGWELMGKYILPLEVLGLVLTAALIGAVIIALKERSQG